MATFSKHATLIHPTRKYSSRKGYTVKTLTIHHTAGNSNAGNLAYLADSPAQASASYLLQTTGRLVGMVPEEYRPWTSGWVADRSGVTVETVNSSGPPTWGVEAIQLEMLAKLAADLADRYDWGQCDEDNVNGHREYMATACPGPYLWPRIPLIINRANEILDEGSDAPTPIPPKPATPSDAFDIQELADEVIRGAWGNGSDRIRRLKAAGYSSNQVTKIQSEINNRFRKPGVPKTKASVNQLAKEVIAGKWGNNPYRMTRLSEAGHDAAAVQREVNNILR
jgi:N-acetylmuramoyl-L-alanine amidase